MYSPGRHCWKTPNAECAYGTRARVGVLAGVSVKPDYSESPVFSPASSVDFRPAISTRSQARA